jgi:tRNA (guanine9-N1)-methyltransferase
MVVEEEKNREATTTNISTCLQSANYCSDQNVEIINSSPELEGLQVVAGADDGIPNPTTKEERCVVIAIMGKSQQEQQHKEQGELGIGDGRNEIRSIDNTPERGAMSKKAIKRMIKIEKVKEYRKRKKEMEKEIKRSKALAAGRNLDDERIVKTVGEDRARASAGGEGRISRENMWNDKFKDVDASFSVCIDCAYDDLMTEKEIKSLAQQIRYCYAQNKRSSHPCRFIVSNLGGKTLEQLQKESGFPNHWKSRGFECSEKSLRETFPNVHSQLVYLTSDSDNVLEQLSDDTVYVIGGIVDRNRLKRVAITQAERLGLKTAKLPIDQYIKLSATKVLTCNHVFQILLKYREHGNMWKKALVEVLPQRKNIQEIPNDDDDCVQVKIGSH